METSEYKKQVMWLLPLPPEKRIEAVEELLEQLKVNK